MSISDKWAIKNCPEVGKWFNKQTDSEVYTGTFLQTNSYLHSYNDINEKLEITSKLSYASNFIRTGFTEITIEEFRQHVVETPSVENYDYLISLFKKYNIT